MFVSRIEEPRPRLRDEEFSEQHPLLSTEVEIRLKLKLKLELKRLRASIPRYSRLATLER